ncbi:chondroitinase family polysaccharide lyase [Paenibacillus chungangensis]|uniref:Chondroitinase family polysaccharide lyase n=1 Tax=Paenibacillus chungangensis TaxID=696535 RepID=A0ABW3HUM1_9BACL
MIIQRIGKSLLLSAATIMAITLGLVHPLPATAAWDEEETAVFVFEEGIPESISAGEGSSIDISYSRYKDGAASLRWSFQSASELIINQPIGFSNINKDTFGIWIYNEQSVDDDLTFQFTRDGQPASSFRFGLNYEGWRTAWVPFGDMEGNPVKEMNKLVITAPESIEEGTLYLDQIVLSNPVDVRHPTRDAQVPFVNPEADTRPSAHWQALYLFDGLLPSDDDDNDEEATEEEIAAVDDIEAKYLDFVFQPEPLSEEAMHALRATFQSYAVIRDEEYVQGRPVNLVHIKDIYPKAIKGELTSLVNQVEVRAYTDFMLKVAKGYHSANNAADREELQNMFIDLSYHLRDQGWAWGSSLGTVHHLGYNFRGFYPAILLMKEELEEAGLLPWAQETMSWYSGIGRIYEPLEESYANIDILNTTLQGMLASILMLDDEDERVRLLRRLSAWLSDGLLPAPGLMPALKPDGSGFHHMGFYPAYTKGAFNGLTPVVYMLGNTPYRISEQAHTTLKQAIMAMRLYANKYEWLLSVSGRHPTGTERVTSYAFKYLALSGTPDGSSSIDPEAAGAYLRLVEPDRVDATTDWLLTNGYEAEDDPSGHWTMNYGTLSLHRRDHWLVGVRGHNRYFWSNELYSNANWYGRYTTYGQIEIKSQGDPVNNLDSGYSHDGWNWNRWPGTTTIHLPLDELKATSFTEMLLTDETYAGGLNIEGKNGMFAMKLHEHPKYDESHRARKSVFMFDNRIIALGSDIENTDADHRTETTLFQNALSSEAGSDPLWIGEQAAITAFPYERNMTLQEPTWLVDNKGNGYYVPAGQSVTVQKSTQMSKNQKNGADTSGDFATAWLDHGKAPTGESYEYAIVVNATPGKMHAFARRMSQPAAAPYRVLRKDTMAHIVNDRAAKTTGYALFEAIGNGEGDDPIVAPGDGHLAAVDTPSMVMIKEKGSHLVLSAVDPDLRLYEGIDEEQYDENGNFVGGQGPYDRPWRENASIMRPLRITLHGEWELESEADNYRLVSVEAGQTVIELDCRDAMPIELELKRARRG